MIRPAKSPSVELLNFTLHNPSWICSYAYFMLASPTHSTRNALGLKIDCPKDFKKSLMTNSDHNVPSCRGGPSSSSKTLHFREVSAPKVTRCYVPRPLLSSSSFTLACHRFYNQSLSSNSAGGSWRSREKKGFENIFNKASLPGHL